jgi:acyl carrier protein
MDDAALLDRLRGVVAGVIGADRVPADVSAATPLADEGLWLDSLELLQVVLAAEAEFGIVFEPGEDLVGGGLQTLGTLADLVRRRSVAPSPNGSRLESSRSTRR